MKKKLLVSLLSCSMVLGMLAGCGQSASTDSAPAAPAADTASEPAATEAEAPRRLHRKNDRRFYPSAAMFLYEVLFCNDRSNPSLPLSIS